ncbi:MAG: hypothetical protein HN644_03255 [Rhodospirillales bacterium]|nr:hypothetical protein [Rhodospirillales bacterium]MBT4040040.1 hypothetical protein [Rhodospirillales bacterium]MBT4627861.1 hypothetical protein [Rhodospirillales bacterium]MBT5351401.1 hypothetical protein [Rhodospirillales bacterium]MBT5522216.1 hypothetical protein [Rhodospirillales bacterium]
MPEQLNDPDYCATRYPYQVPERSYVMDDSAHVVVDHDDHLADLAGRRPVLAVGSNMSPQQLGRKFPLGSIPVTRVHLHDFDTVFSTHFTSYGAIPATLFHSPGTVVTLFINWLNAEQEEHMHGTEIASENYQFSRLNSLTMDIENAPALDHVYLYLSSRGALSIDGNPVPMLEASARNRRWQAMGQDDIQAHARTELAPEHTHDDFVRENIMDDEIRRTRTDRLHQSAVPFEYEFTERVR